LNKILEKYKDILSPEEIHTLLEINSTSILFFDMDGTLIDTDYANFLSYKKAIQETINSNDDFLYNINKRFTRQTIKELFPTINQTNFEKIIQQKNKIYKNYLFKTKLNNLFAEILQKYSKTNITVLITHSHKDRAVMILKYHRIFDKFTHKFYQQNEDNGRVNKFEYALKYLDVPANSVIVFENEDIEINEAIITGIPIENIIKKRI
jgi:beta-phosphoglucomutase-like phosphatase (HAD superfamily)